MTSALATYGSSRTIVRKTFAGTHMTLPAIRLKGIDYEWTQQSWSPISNPNTILGFTSQVVDIAYGAGLYVAVTMGPFEGAGGIYTSPDLVTWTSRSPSGVFTNVIWTGTQFVARRTAASFFTSPDGITWTTRAEGAAASAYHLNYVSSLGLHVVHTQSGTVLYTSPDVVTWTLRAVGSNISGPGAFGAGVYVFPTEAGMKYTTNFSSFTTATLKDEYGNTITWDSGSQNCMCHGIAWDGSKFHAVLKFNGLIPLCYIVSSDGITWSIVSYLIPPNPINGPGNQYKVQGNTYYVQENAAGLRRNSTLCVVNGVVFAYLLKQQTFNSGSSTGISINIQILRLNGDSWHELDMGPMVGGSSIANTLYTGAMRNANGHLFAMPFSTDGNIIPAKFELNLNARELVYVL